MPWVLVAFLSLAVPLGFASAVRAECAVYFGFEQVVRESPVVVVGRVLSVNDGSIDLDVSWVVKGLGVTPGRVRVWDPWANSSVSVGLHRLKTGAEVVLAGVTIQVMLTGHMKLDEAARPTDVSVMACRESFRVFDSEEATSEFIRKTIPQLA